LRIGAKSSNPEAMAQNRNMRRTGNVVFRAKVAAESRADAQNRKNVCGNSFPGELFRCSLAGELKEPPYGRSDVLRPGFAISIVEISRGGRVFRKSVGRGCHTILTFESR
jgi:hypothetical protein